MSVAWGNNRRPRRHGTATAAAGAVAVDAGFDLLPFVLLIVALIILWWYLSKKFNLSIFGGVGELLKRWVWGIGWGNGSIIGETLGWLKQGEPKMAAEILGGYAGSELDFLLHGNKDMTGNITGGVGG
jgi:hypothetical protein